MLKRRRRNKDEREIREERNKRTKRRVGSKVGEMQGARKRKGLKMGGRGQNE